VKNQYLLSLCYWLLLSILYLPKSLPGLVTNLLALFLNQPIVRGTALADLVFQSLLKLLMVLLDRFVPLLKRRQVRERRALEPAQMALVYSVVRSALVALCLRPELPVLACTPLLGWAQRGSTLRRS